MTASSVISAGRSATVSTTLQPATVSSSTSAHVAIATPAIVFKDWLRSDKAVRVVLVEVGVNVNGVETTRYLSSRHFNTGASDTPSNTAYLGVINGGVSLTEQMSLDGSASLTYGDIEISNASGEFDSWLDDIWGHRDVRVYLGDINWSRGDFQLVFDGIVADIDSRSADTLNIKLRDKLERLNTPVTELKIGDTAFVDYNPTPTPTPDPAPAPSPSVPAHIVEYHGDSFIYGFDGGSGGGQVSRTTPYHLANAFSNITVRNEGVNSSSSTKLLNGTDGVHSAWATHLASSNCNVVIISFGFSETYDLTVDQFKTNLTTLYNQATAAGKKVIFQTTHVIDSSMGSGFDLRAQAVSEVATATGAGFIEMYAYTQAQFTGGLLSWLPDGYHPTQEGYDIIGARVASVYANIYNAIAPAPAPTPSPETTGIRYIRDWLNGSVAFNGNSSSYWVEIRALDASGANVAVGAPVTANFTSSMLSLITDGIINSESYVTAAGPLLAYVTVDLGSVKQVASVTRWHYYTDSRVFAGTKTEVSADGVTWIPIFDSAISGTYAETAAGKTSNAPFKSTTQVRYIRDWLNGSEGFNGNSSSYWVEVEALDSNGTNVALGKPVTTNSDSTDLALITDGNIDSNSYATATGPLLAQVTIDLQAIYDIASITRWHYYADNRVFADTKTEVSIDNTNWVTVYDSAVSGTYAETSSGKTTLAPFGSSSSDPAPAPSPSPTTPAPIPSFSVNLSAYGGLPGATGTTIISAFNLAFTALRNNGGGTLFIDVPGTYDLGTFPQSDVCINQSNLQNIMVSGYGSTIRSASVADIHYIFRFTNFQNLTIAGLKFQGYNHDMDTLRGPCAIDLKATVARGQFKTLDCEAENCVIFVNIQENATDYLITELDINGTCRTGYYGVLIHYNARNSKYNLVCHDMRRALLQYGAQSSNYTFVHNGTVGADGSNGWCYPSATGDEAVSDCNFNLTVNGDVAAWNAMMLMGHLGSETANVYRNVNVDMTVNSATGTTSTALFEFVHENPPGTKPSATSRRWENVELTGSITGTYLGQVVRNTSTSTGSPNSVRVEDSLLASASGLPSYFTIFAALLTPRPIPNNTVNLSDYGGVPGASATTIANAFVSACNQLKTLGGGTLFVQSGTYNFGSRSGGSAITINDLSNVLISAYGAQFVMNTTANVTPVFLNFSNPDNVTIVGMSFQDTGTDLSVSWRGAVCIWVSSSSLKRDFKLLDCSATSVVSFISCDQRNSSAYMMEGFDIHGTITNSYYGVQMLRTGRFSTCDISTLNVRRAFISHSTRDWDINVNVNRTGGLGSNACVVLSTFQNFPVLDCVVNITATGALNGYSCLGEIIHQSADGVYSYANNVDFNIAVNNATSPASVGFINFAAEPEAGGGIRSTTVGAWQQVDITGTVTGSYSGKIVSNQSVSSASTNQIRVASNLWGYQSGLPSYFQQF